MSYFLIKSLKYHKKMRDRIAKESKAARNRITDSDAHLSLWAINWRGAEHSDAITALELGREHGSSEPAARCYVLIDSKGRNIGAKLEKNQWHRYEWVLPKQAAKRYGRWRIPRGIRSRIQRELGLRESFAVVTIQRATEVYSPSCNIAMREIQIVGAPVLATYATY